MAVLLRSRIRFGQSGISANEALLCWTESVSELTVVNQHDCSSEYHHLEVQHDGVSIGYHISPVEQENPAF